MGRLSSEDVALITGILLLIYEMKVKGIDWVMDTLIMLYITLTVFNFIKEKIRKIMGNDYHDDD